MNRKPGVAVVVGALVIAFVVASCGEDAPTQAELPLFEVPEWVKVAPEQIAEAKKHGVPVAFENDLGMRFVLIPAGTFLMGSPEDEKPPRLIEDTETQHEVTITKPHYLQMMEVTNGQYRRKEPQHDSGSCRKSGHALDEDRQPVVLSPSTVFITLSPLSRSLTGEGTSDGREREMGSWG